MNPLAAARCPWQDSRVISTLDRTGLVLVLVTPVLLLHAPSFAEATIALTAVGLLLRSVLLSDWSWMRATWLRLSLLWWGWVVFCSIPIPVIGLGPGGLHSLGEALAVIRFILFAAALDAWVLRSSIARRWLFGIVAACAIWVGVECVHQFVSGRDLFGYKRGGDGELTGPFRKPRAGPALVRILFPVLVPPVAALLARRRGGATAAAFALTVVAVLVMVLIGQRMPLMLTGLGLVAAALLLPRLRLLVLAAGLAGLVLVAASPIVSPPTYHRLVQKFSRQMEDFPASQYGQLYARAWHIAEARPLVGRGFDGFRTGCPMPRYFGPTFDGSQPQGGGAAICAAHPHNFYFQAMSDGGFPGLVLFCAAVIGWMVPLGRGLWRRADPLRVGLFAAMLIQVWPIASTSDFVNMPLGGWFFLTLGWGLAEAHWRVPVTLAQDAARRSTTSPGTPLGASPLAEAEIA